MVGDLGVIGPVSYRGMKPVRDSEHPYRGYTWAVLPVSVGERGFLKPPEAILGWMGWGEDC